MPASENLPPVAIVMGSDSDLPIMQAAAEALQGLGVGHSLHIMSAHRTPGLVAEFAGRARERGVKVVIAGAGGAAHLAGVIAAHTTLPVIGVPISTKLAGGLDSLLSIVQMPGGVPVATVAVDGARNAGILAAQMLALGDERLAQRLAELKEQTAGEVAAKNKRLQESGR